MFSESQKKRIQEMVDSIKEDIEKDSSIEFDLFELMGERNVRSTYEVFSKSLPREEWKKYKPAEEQKIVSPSSILSPSEQTIQYSKKKGGQNTAPKEIQGTLIALANTFDDDSESSDVLDEAKKAYLNMTGKTYSV